MKIHGFKKTSLIDMPGKIVTTVFASGCNFNCSYCHNKDMVGCSMSETKIKHDEVINHLENRKGLIDGICITGGEPTLHAGLKKFIKKLKEKDIYVKLDTNGYKPEILKELLDENLIDYVAMDIKNSLEKYDLTTGVKIDKDKILKSINILKNSDIDYEFRTTVIKDLHNHEDIKNIADLIKGSKKIYLQQYRKVDGVDLMPHDKSILKEYEKILKKHVNEVTVRGI